MYPFTCARAVVATPTATLGGAEEAKTQDYQSNAQAGGVKSKGDKVGFLRQEPCRGNLPNTSRAATLEPKSSDTIDNIGTKAREAPAWWHADLREDSATAPTQQPASQHGAARLVSLDAHRSEAKRRRTGLVSLPPPIK